MPTVEQGVLRLARIVKANKDMSVVRDNTTELTEVLTSFVKMHWPVVDWNRFLIISHSVYVRRNRFSSEVQNCLKLLVLEGSCPVSMHRHTCFSFLALLSSPPSHSPSHQSWQPAAPAIEWIPVSMAQPWTCTNGPPLSPQLDRLQMKHT